MNYILIALGSAIGGVSRYWCSQAAALLFGTAFPFGTLIVNVIGAFIIGTFAALSAEEGKFFIHPHMQLFVMVGLCGGYTTFSAFSLQSFELLKEGKIFSAGLYITLSIFICLSAVCFGYLLTQFLQGSKT